MHTRENMDEYFQKNLPLKYIKILIARILRESRPERSPVQTFISRTHFTFVKHFRVPRNLFKHPRTFSRVSLLMVTVETVSSFIRNIASPWPRKNLRSNAFKSCELRTFPSGAGVTRSIERECTRAFESMSRRYPFDSVAYCFAGSICQLRPPTTSRGICTPSCESARVSAIEIAHKLDVK